MKFLITFDSFIAFLGSVIMHSSCFYINVEIGINLPPKPFFIRLRDVKLGKSVKNVGFSTWTRR